VVTDAESVVVAYVFDALNVEDGAIVAYLPRADRAADVVTLLMYVTNVAGAEGEGVWFHNIVPSAAAACLRT
jgi:hypothetical protein